MILANIYRITNYLKLLSIIIKPDGQTGSGKTVRATSKIDE